MKLKNIQLTKYKSLEYPKGHKKQGKLLPDGEYYAVPGGGITTHAKALEWGKQNNIGVTTFDYCTAE